MISWRISKYNPIYRNAKDEYQKDEWTSCHDIGKLFQGRRFTINDYLNIENAYICVLMSFIKNASASTLVVKHLEK